LAGVTARAIRPPHEGTRREMLCPTCGAGTINVAAFHTVWHDSYHRAFAGWQCTRCGTLHSGS